VRNVAAARLRDYFILQGCVILQCFVARLLDYCVFARFRDCAMVALRDTNAMQILKISDTYVLHEQ
jgi:hypothetical protein